MSHLPAENFYHRVGVDGLVFPHAELLVIGHGDGGVGVVVALGRTGALVGQKADFIPGIRTLDEVQEVGIFDPATYEVLEAVSADEAIDGMLL